MKHKVTASAHVPDPSAIAAAWWDREGDAYLRDNPGIGRTRFQWCPEGWTEEDLDLIGPQPGKVLEVGAGSAPCSRWLAARGIDVTATDLSRTMLAAAAELNDETGISFPLIQADILALPFAPGSFDTVFTSFGAIGFIPDLQPAFTGIFEVLTPGGHWVYAATHPMSWVFPDSPHAQDLRVVRGYGNDEAYVETINGIPDYAEFSHTVADHINALTEAGFTDLHVLEPMWKDGGTWGAWGPDRNTVLPGTLIVSARRPAR